MRTHVLSRLMIFGIFVSLLAVGPMTAQAQTHGDASWIDTMSRENVLVQACAGFDLTSSYTTTRTYRVVRDPTGTTVFERRAVSFTGTFADVQSGQSVAYDGKFVRTADYEQGTVTITDLALRLGLPSAGAVTVTMARLDHDVIDNPPAVVLAFAPFEVRNRLCALFGDPQSSMPMQARRQLDPDPCDTTPSGKSC